METFSALLTLCAGNSPATGEFPSQRPVTRDFDGFFICVWTNCWANNREAGDVRRHCGHYDVTVMTLLTSSLALHWPLCFGCPRCSLGRTYRTLWWVCHWGGQRSWRMISPQTPYCGDVLTYVLLYEGSRYRTVWWNSLEVLQDKMIIIFHRLTHCGLVTPYGGISPSQHWLRWWPGAWRHQAITWTNVDLSLVKFGGIQLRVMISQWVPILVSCITSLKSILEKLRPLIQGAHELQ